MTPAGSKAEALISELGISAPNELDVDAIAMATGVEVRYEEMTGCEASLVGFQNKAIATINPSGVRGRERFSIAHEVGHWQLHRGRSFQCRADAPDANLSSNKVLEKEADTFAAHLLMPSPIFLPMVKTFGKPNFQNLNTIAGELETSLMATALRLANVNTLPVIVACYNIAGLRWSLPAGDIPKRWVLRQDVDEDSFTYDLLKSGKECKHLGKQPAEVFFENNDAGKYEVHEQCIGSRAGEVLTLLYLGPEMLEAGFDFDVRRVYTDKGAYFSKGRR